MLFEAARFQEDPQLKSLTAASDFRPNAPPDSYLRTIPQIDEALVRHAFQRATAHLARKLGDLAAGRIGDHGVVFVSSAGGSLKKRKQRLLDLTERVQALARRDHGLSLSFGLNLALPSIPVSLTYQGALGAAESALARGTRLVVADRSEPATEPSLRRLRAELAEVAKIEPEHLEARFDRYLEVVISEYGYRIDAVRGHLDAAFERVAEQFVKSGFLDQKSLKDLGERLDRAAGETKTADDLIAAFRRSIAELGSARKSPIHAKRDRSLQSALDHIHHHYAEALPLDRLARIAGFNADYFSRLFKERAGMTFERYVRAYRVEQAKRLLGNTTLGVARVAELCGFHSAQYFSRTFRDFVATTPLKYRKKRVRRH